MLRSNESLPRKDRSLYTIPMSTLTKDLRLKTSGSQRIIGLDPGYGRLGFGIIDVIGHEVKAVAYGVITTPATPPPSGNGSTSRQTGSTGTSTPTAGMAIRLLEIYKDVKSLIEKHKPDAMSIEEIFFVQSTTTALKVAEVRGVLLLLGAEFGLKIIEVKPMEVKMALTGYGKADKRQMQEMVKTIFKLDKIPKPDDAADALAIAFAASGRVKF